MKNILLPKCAAEFFDSQILQVSTIEFPLSPPFLMNAFLSFLILWKVNQAGFINPNSPITDQCDREGEF
jgi:hypothetical protein